MKKVARYQVLVVFCLSAIFAFGQISYGGQPNSLTFDLKFPTQSLSLPLVNTVALQKEDQLLEANGANPRIGISQSVNINPLVDGTWEELTTGGWLWTIKIKSSSAKALILEFDYFQISQGSSWFVYGKGGKKILGAFDHRSNPKGEEFAIGPIYGDELVIEMTAPVRPAKNDFLISGVGHLYRQIQTPGLNDFGDSAPCEVNINCTEGNNWQDEKRGVARILLLIDMVYYWCSGSLVNNAKQDCTNYFLTAWHCGIGASAADLNMWIFDFNYEAIGCANGTEPAASTMTGATMISNSNDNGGDTGSDFLLLKLNDTEIPCWV
ncbi:MAG: hypothetical protein IPL46_01330 [Saprospiraceae bacterium]|nr:hypothetical protein [Saprospiraceae bacterium]